MEKELHALSDKPLEWWDACEDIGFSQHILEAAPYEISQLLELVGSNAINKVLDLPCGVGRHSVELAKNGLHVTGVDHSKYFLEKAKERANNNDVAINFFEGDMRTFCEKDNYDLLINLWDSFGYFKDKEDDEKFLRNCYTSLKKGGIFVIEIVPKETWAMTVREENGTINAYGVWDKVLGEIPNIKIQSEILDDWSWVITHCEMIVDEQTIIDSVGKRLYAASELKELIKKTGFQNIKVYGDFSGLPFNHESLFKTRKLVIVAEK